MRLKILNQISELEDKHCNGCKVIEEIRSSGSERFRYYNTHCEVGQELNALGSQLLDISNTKVKATLEKGEDMTLKDVLMLREKEVKQVDIARALGMHTQTLRQMEEELEKSMKNKTNVEKAVEMSKDGMSVKEIAKELGLKESTVYQYIGSAAKGKKQIVKPKKEVKPVKNVEKVAVESTKEVVELKKKVEELKMENSRWQNLSARHESDYRDQLEAKANLTKKLRKFEEYARKLETELDAAKAEHIEVLNENSNLKEKLAQAKHKPMEVAYDKQEQVDQLSIRLKTEQEKHRHLLSYLILEKSQ